jgi:hypothetical protein
MEKETSIEGIFKEYKQVERETRGLFGTPLFRRSRAVKSFSQSHPEYILYLGNQFKSIAGPVERVTTYSQRAKLEKVLRDYEISKEPSRIKRFVKRHPAVLPAVVGAQALVSAMSPEHPLMVDAYLADNFKNAIVDNTPTTSKEELSDFLLNKDYIETTVRTDFVKDVKDVTSERNFVIIKKNGKLEQKNIRTFNSNLSIPLPEFLRAYLDRSSFTRLDDYVDLWKEGEEIATHGHSHITGELPSKADNLVSYLTNGYDVVISNGLVPCIYIDGEHIPFESNLKIDEVSIKVLKRIPSIAAPFENYPFTEDTPYFPEEERIKNVKSFWGFFTNEINLKNCNLRDLYKKVKLEKKEFEPFIDAFKSTGLDDRRIHEFMTSQWIIDSQIMNRILLSEGKW